MISRAPMMLIFAFSVWSGILIVQYTISKQRSDKEEEEVA